RVIVDQVTLGEPARRKHDLVEMRELHLMPEDIHAYPLPGLAHVSTLMRSQPFRQPDGLDHTRRVGDVFPRNIECGPVVRRSTDKWQAQGPIHAALEGD